MITLETFGRKVDPLAKALDILREGVKVGRSVRLSDLVTKKGGEAEMRKAIMRLIDAGWSEYEFTDSNYTEVRRLDLPDFARNYFKELRKDKKHEVTRTKYTTEQPKAESGTPIESIGGKVSRGRPKRDRVQLSREQLGELQPNLF